MAPESDSDVLLGRLALHYKLLTKEQVQSALRGFRESLGGDLPTYLVSEGFLNDATVRKLLAAREQYLRRQGGAAVTATEATPASSPASGAAASEPEAAPATSSATADGAAAGGATAPVSSGEGQGRLGWHPSVTLEELLTATRRLNGSDLHVHAGAELRLRLNGRLESASPVLAPEETERLILGLMAPEIREQLEERYQVDFSFALEGVGRFRANAYRQQRGLDAVYRAIAPQPPTLEELGLPASLESLTRYHQGIVLFTGPAGCGKSSTMAAMIHLINQARPDHILVIEDPIEYVHTSARCVVNQRQVGPHTESFARALRAALREDPDVIAIGELRDLETISLALTAAETGHLVLGTLHTSSAIRTLNRLLGAFPPDQQAQIRTMVSESMRAIVSQRLVPRADGEGRVAAIEVMINSKAIGNLIRENRTFQIHSVMQTGSRLGNVLLDASLAELVEAGTITKEAARMQAEDPKRFA